MSVELQLDDGYPSTVEPVHRPGPRKRWLILFTSTVLLALFTIVGIALRIEAAPGAPLSCSWTAVQFSGGQPAQRGAVRCYLKALAEKDASEMKRVIPQSGFGGDETVTGEDFTFAGDSSSGPARVTFKQNPVDSGDAEVDIVFADGRKDVQELHIADPTSTNGWRFWDAHDHSTQGYINLK